MVSARRHQNIRGKLATNHHNRETLILVRSAAILMLTYLPVYLTSSFQVSLSIISITFL